MNVNISEPAADSQQDSHTQANYPGSRIPTAGIQHKWYVLPFLLSPRPQLLKQKKKKIIQLEANKCDPPFPTRQSAVLSIP